jgi:hypothetical protein
MAPDNETRLIGAICGVLDKLASLLAVAAEKLKKEE